MSAFEFDAVATRALQRLAARSECSEAVCSEAVVIMRALALYEIVLALSADEGASVELPDGRLVAMTAMRERAP